METVDRTTGEVLPFAEITMSAEIDKIAGALAKAQGSISNPGRNREVEVKTKTGGIYKFAYATFDAILDAVRKPLSENGLCYTQTLSERGGKYRLRTTLMHASGQWLASETPLMPQEQGNQAFGSALSYMKRYALCAILGVSADEDDDGNAADGNPAEKRDRSPQAKAAPRKAAPKTAEEDEPWRATANAIKAAIDAAPHLTALNALMETKGATADGLKEGSDLATVKAASETAYQFLLDRAQKRRGIFLAAPAEAAE